MLDHNFFQEYLPSTLLKTINFSSLAMALFKDALYVFTKTYNTHMSVSRMSYYLSKQLFKLQSVCFKEVIRKKFFGIFYRKCNLC